MNKKIAMLLFAIGLGAASAPAFASCTFYCAQDRLACLNAGGSVDECAAEFALCIEWTC